MNFVDTLDLKLRKSLWTHNLKPQRNFVDTFVLKTRRNFVDTLYAAQKLIMALAVGPNSVVVIPFFT
jgi:hypothetical protein